VKKRVQWPTLPPAIQRMQPWIVTGLSVLAWGIAWLALGPMPWLVLGLQLWAGYALLWLAQQGMARWLLARGLPTMLGLTLLVALIAGVLVLPLSSDFLVDRLSSWHWVLARSLPPSFFALAFVLPGILTTWREQQRRDRQLALAEQQRAVAELSKQVTLAELKSLQAQVEPHFLYNTLAGVQYLVRHNPGLADQMLEHLITYLRRAVPSMRAQASTVQAECELVQAYLEIMKLRLGGRLQTEVVCNADVTQLPLPPMMLATLVENAIKHGIEPLPQGGRIAVLACREGDDLCITVTDTGAGLPSAHDAATVVGDGVGLANIADRLRALYGDAASLSVCSRLGGGVVASLRIALAQLTNTTHAEVA
jgi:sensor histidine kinase YesM